MQIKHSELNAVSVPMHIGARMNVLRADRVDVRRSLYKSPRRGSKLHHMGRKWTVQSEGS